MHRNDFCQASQKAGLQHQLAKQHQQAWTGQRVRTHQCNHLCRFLLMTGTRDAASSSIASTWSIAPLGTAPPTVAPWQPHQRQPGSMEQAAAASTAPQSTAFQQTHTKRLRFPPTPTPTPAHQHTSTPTPTHPQQTCGSHSRCAHLRACCPPGASRPTVAADLLLLPGSARAGPG
jgi:hypothetical protein